MLEDVHFLTVCRYVEANALRAWLAENWRWGSLWSRENGKSALHDRLRAWPVDRPRNWLAEVNRDWADHQAIPTVRRSVVRGLPLGSGAWQSRTAKRLGLQITLRP